MLCFRSTLQSSLALATALLIGTAGSAAAQTITSPAPGVLTSARDFATDVHNDPWDFSNVEDLSPFPDEQGGFLSTADARRHGRSVFLNGGKFKATTDTSGGNQISMLFRGGVGLLNTGRHGAEDAQAIPTARYGKLAVKMKLGPGATGPPNHMLVTWHHRPYAAPDQAQNAGQMFFAIPGSTSNYVIHTVDLITREWWDINGATQTSNLEELYPGEAPKAWSANPLVRGLQLRATSEGASLPVEIDWVRLVPADHQSDAKFLRVQFAGCTSPRMRITDAEGTYILPVTSVDGDELDFNYGVLAPGSYTMGLQCNEGASNTQPLVINAPPLVTVVNPDAAGGQDFATTVLSNAWDMDSLADVVVTGVENAPAPQVSGNTLVATAANGGGDPQVTLLDGGTNLISTRRYRNVTFTLELETPFGLNENTGDGSMARVFWGSQTSQAANSMTTTNDMLVWPGQNTYTIDLSALTLANLGLEPDCVASVGCPQTPWAQHSVRFFRIDPHEATKSVVFRMGPVSLTAPDEVDTGGAFNVLYRFTDADAGATYDAEIFLEDSIGARQSLGTMVNVAKDTLHTFAYNVPPAHTPGEYRIYVQVTERQLFHGGLNEDTNAEHSTGPLRIYNAAASTPKTIISTPSPNTTQPTPFSISGCAYDDGNNLGINVDDILAFAIAGPNVTGVQAGTTQVLGFGNTLGNLAFGPLTGASVTCPGVPAPFNDSGFTINDITGLSPGNWTLRLITRSTIDGSFSVSEVPIAVTNATLPPTNLVITGGAGAVVNLSWTSPVGGPPIGGYQVDFALDSAFTQAFGQAPLIVAPTTTAQVNVPAVQANSAGPWYFRVRSVAPSGAPGVGVSNTVFTMLPVGAAGPGAPVLVAAQVTSNPITLSWSAGPGGVPGSYTLHAGTSPGGSDLGVFPMGTITSVTAEAPAGVGIYARVIAANAGGAATSNEINFQLGGGVTAPAAPVLTPTQVSANPIALSWAPGAGGGAPSSYTLHAGTAPGASNLGVFPMGGATSIAAEAPVGVSIYVRVIGTNGAGSATSNEINFQIGGGTAPGPPKLAAPSVSGNTVTFNWTAPSSGGAATSYRLVARVSPTGPLVAAIPVGGSTFSVDAPAGAYFVSLIAVNASGESAESNQVTVTIP